MVKSLSSTGNSVTQYTIKIEGPIMPFHMHRLCKLFEKSQGGYFELTASNLMHSTALNCCKIDNAHKYDGKNLDFSESESLESCFGINKNSLGLSSFKYDAGVYYCS